MGLLQYVAVDDIRVRGNIRDSDVLKLRRSFNEDAAISASEAEALFELNNACTVKDPAWADFFIEAITDYVVNQAQPEGYIVADNATWLMERITSDGRVERHIELELLVHVLEKARWSPPSLVRFALDQVKEAVLQGSGPLRAGQPAEPGVISVADVDLLRRILFAFGGDGNIAVTRSEADALFDINKAITPGTSPPQFTDFFVKAVANAALHGFGLAVPSRAEALRAEARRETTDMRSAGSLLADTVAGGEAGTSARARMGGFAGRMFSGASQIWGTYRLQSSEEQALTKLERQRLEIITGETMAEADAAWLVSRFSENQLSENERALLQFLKRESPVLPPVLRDFADRVETAA
jgi:hypothetical protein